MAMCSGCVISDSNTNDIDESQQLKLSIRDTFFTT